MSAAEQPLVCTFDTQAATPRVDRAKRGLARTQEPSERVGATTAGVLRFVIQKHAARRLHYDLRLEEGGVLKSWAVLGEIPFSSGQKCLAIEVEDHPLGYETFEGVIPSDSYGAGTVMVWDQGRYAVVGSTFSEAYRGGKIHVVFGGVKCRGEWTLLRMRPTRDDKPSWLLLKNRPGSRPPKSPERDRSVLSGRTFEEIARDAAKPQMR